VSRMFKFITDTINPVGGRCPYGCSYCWAQGEKGLVNRYDMRKYRGAPFLDEKVLRKRFGSGEFLFAVDMRDLFSGDVPRGMIVRVLEWMGESPEADFLLLTKNPKRYGDFVGLIPGNVVLGATIESNRDYPEVSNAPPQSWRLKAMEQVRYHFRGHRLFVSIEPILDCDPWDFADRIMRIEPWKVAVGFDNYGNRLPEPSLEKVERLISYLEQFTEVERKTIRRAWWA